MNHLAFLLPLLNFLPYFSVSEPYPFPSTSPSGSRPEVEQIRQLERSLSEKETENRSLRERIKELEILGQRTEEVCQCLPKPPNATGLVASKVEYRCQEAKGAGFSLQCSDVGDPCERREGHGAAAMKDGSGNVLLLGGYLNQFTAEIVPHGPVIPLQHSVFGSCLIHLVDQFIVTGGGTEYHHYVDRYDLTGKSRDLTGFIGPLPDMLQGRGGHACGSFTDSNGDQVLIVTGGRTPDPNDIYSTMPIDTTELLFPAAISWTPGAALPRPLVGARAASLPFTLIVTGGQVDDDNDGEEDPMDQIIRYLPNEERWEIQEWKLPLPSSNHALLPVHLDKLCT